MSNIEQYLEKPAKELVALPALSLPESAKERHRIYCTMLMALGRYYWNGNKFGHGRTYPLNPKPDGVSGNFLKSDYIGHNIAAIAVDGDGVVIDFDFNHNEIFNSSAEHAEARLVHRVFSLAQVHDRSNLNGATGPPKSYGTSVCSPGQCWSLTGQRPKRHSSCGRTGQKDGRLPLNSRFVTSMTRRTSPLTQPSWLWTSSLKSSSLTGANLNLEPRRNTFIVIHSDLIDFASPGAG